MVTDSMHSKTRDQAIYIIIRFLRKLVLNKRMNAYRSYKGCLYSRKYQFNQISKSLEIMSMYMMYKYVDGSCMYVTFTIFDYVTRKFIFEGFFK